MELLKRRIVSFIKKSIVSIKYKKQELRYLKQVEAAKSKKSIRVVFFALFESIWKVDYLYRLLENDSNFDPIILVCPIVNYGKKNMLDKMDACYNTLHAKGYRVIKSYNNQLDTYVDVRKDLSPDVIFYTNPYKGLIADRYYIDQFPDILTCYVPYFFNESNDVQFLNHPVHLYSWRFFVETPFHMSFCKKNMLNKGKNIYMSGYPGVDYFLDKSYIPKDVWKIKNNKIKRLIWAPHHTIFESDIVQYSCFLIYAEYMLEMAKKYSHSIQIAFKPHPILKNRLYLCWGKEKTDSYYDEWEHGSNTFLVDGDYIDLFLSSDAMIHDSGSFLIEYLYTNKPVMRTDNNQLYENEFNAFAISCLECYYHANKKLDIESFIVNLINGTDPLYDKRTAFVANYLSSIEELPSEHIYRYLKSVLRH